MGKFNWTQDEVDAMKVTPPGKKIPKANPPISGPTKNPVRRTRRDR